METVRVLIGVSVAGSVLTSALVAGTALVGSGRRTRRDGESVFAQRARLDRERSAAAAAGFDGSGA